MDLNAQLRKEEEAFGDARQIMDDFTKFLRNGGLDVVGANAYDRQQCHDKYESLEVMLQAREYELDNRATSYYGGNPSPESVELNLAILQDIILNAVYFMVPSNETRRVMNSGKLNLLYSRDPSTPYDRRYHNQNIPQWLNSLPRHLFEPYDHTPPLNANEIPRHRIRITHTPPSSPQTSTPSRSTHDQRHTHQRFDSDGTVQATRSAYVTSDARLNDYRYLSHRNRSAYYTKAHHGTKPRRIRWSSFCGCGRRASGYS